MYPAINSLLWNNETKSKPLVKAIPHHKHWSMCAPVIESHQVAKACDSNYIDFTRHDIQYNSHEGYHSGTYVSCILKGLSLLKSTGYTAHNEPLIGNTLQTWLYIQIDHIVNKEWGTSGIFTIYNICNINRFLREIFMNVSVCYEWLILCSCEVEIQLAGRSQKETVLLLKESERDNKKAFILLASLFGIEAQVKCYTDERMQRT